MNWMTCVLLVELLWISTGSTKKDQRFGNCVCRRTIKYIVADNFNGFITGSKYLSHSGGAKVSVPVPVPVPVREACLDKLPGQKGKKNSEDQDGEFCIAFVQKNSTGKASGGSRKWYPLMEKKDGAYLLQVPKQFRWERNVCVMYGEQCNATVQQLLNGELPKEWMVSDTDPGKCTVRCLRKEEICANSTFAEQKCIETVRKDVHFINITEENPNCLNCDNPVKEPEEKLDAEELQNKLNVTVTIEPGKEVDPAQASELMSRMSEVVSAINGSSAEMTLGEGVDGILVKQSEDEEVNEVSFAYMSPNDSMSIIENRDSLTQFSRSVTVSKEAFEKAVQANTSVPFTVVFRFTNLAKDEFNSTVLGNEVLAVEMGTSIKNLTDKININFWNMSYEGLPACRSWNGEGSKPNWTAVGCETVKTGENITCQCTHLTFFAILLTPLNETISSSDLDNLTIITQVGCGLSMFFLSIVLFMHFLLRKAKASKATMILIHLVSAMFLLNFTFLINNFVANLKSSVGCKIMAALMHYFMLATFTWFAVQAFHLCLQLQTRGKIVIRHYILKVSVTSWVLPGVIGIVLLSIGKYGEQVIQADDAEKPVSICWIIDNDTHYIVNIGYYVLVFLLTFTAFIVVISWLYCSKRSGANSTQMTKSGKNIVTIMGLCCMLGITWGFAFFAYGVLRIPSYYIFTVLNSFQGFFLFIYYYNNSHSREMNSDHQNTSSSSSVSTLKTGLENFDNPYIDATDKKN